MERWLNRVQPLNLPGTNFFTPGWRPLLKLESFVRKPHVRYKFNLSPPPTKQTNKQSKKTQRLICFTLFMFTLFLRTLNLHKFYASIANFGHCAGVRFWV